MYSLLGWFKLFLVQTASSANIKKRHPFPDASNQSCSNQCIDECQILHQSINVFLELTKLKSKVSVKVSQHVAVMTDQAYIRCIPVGTSDCYPEEADNIKLDLHSRFKYEECI